MYKEKSDQDNLIPFPGNSHSPNKNLYQSILSKLHEVEKLDPEGPEYFLDIIKINLKFTLKRVARKNKKYTAQIIQFPANNKVI